MYTVDRDEHIDKQTDLCMYIIIFNSTRTSIRHMMHYDIYHPSYTC